MRYFKNFALSNFFSVDLFELQVLYCLGIQFCYFFTARDEDGNLADPSKPSTFIQILRKAQEGHFSRIKVPSAAKQVEVVIEKKKGNTAAIAGGVSGAVSHSYAFQAH